MKSNQQRNWQRTVRTPQSERYHLVAGERMLAIVDLHLFNDGTVDGTVVLLEGSGLGEADVSPLLRDLEETQLPGITLGDGSLMYTVVTGKLLGTFESSLGGHTELE